jgi:hypothetical protein
MVTLRLRLEAVAWAAIGRSRNHRELLGGRMAVLSAVVYAVIAGLSALVAAGKVPSDAIEWCGFALVVLTAGWGKYTNSEDMIQHPLKAGRDLKIGE